MGRFQLELIYCFTFIFHRLSIKQLLFLSCRPFVVIKTFPTGLVGVEVTSTEVITTKGLQDINNNYLMEGRWKIKVNKLFKLAWTQFHQRFLGLPLSLFPSSLLLKIPYGNLSVSFLLTWRNLFYSHVESIYSHQKYKIYFSKHVFYSTLLFPNITCLLLRKHF